MTSRSLNIECDLLDLGDGRLQGRLAVGGELDSATTNQLKEKVADLRRSGATGLIIDTTDVTFLDSSGLRALLDARVQMEGAGGSFLIDGMSPAVHHLLELTGMLDLGNPQTHPGTE